MDNILSEKVIIKEVFLNAEQIHFRVKQLAETISNDYLGKEFTVISVLKGSVIFVSDLLRNLKTNCSVDFIRLSSYKGNESSGVVKLISDINENPAGKNLLIVEDIVDTGFTLSYLQKKLLAMKPSSLKTCVLLDKYSSRKVPVQIDYRGFMIPDQFVAGYGLDYLENYRGLPYIGIISR